MNSYDLSVHKAISREASDRAKDELERLLLEAVDTDHSRWSEPGKLLAELADELALPYKDVVEATWRLEAEGRIGVFRTHSMRPRLGSCVEQVFIPLHKRPLAVA